MTRKKLRRRVEFWRRRICPEWRVAIMPTPPPGEDRPFVAIMQSDLTVEEIRVHFKDEVLGFVKYDVDRIVVHELLHALVSRVLDHDQVLRPHVAPAMWTAYVDGRGGDEEQLVNRLAHVLVATEHDDWPIYGTYEARSSVEED